MKFFDKILSPIRKAYSRVNDGLVNMLSASVAHRDVTNPMTNAFLSEITINYAQLENIYMTTWTGKKIVEIPNDYIFKNGFIFSIKGYPEIEKKVLDLYHEREIENRLKEADANARIYGGSIILPKDPYQDPNQPYDLSQFAIAPNKIEFIVKDLSYLAVTPFVEVVSEKYFEPNIISISGLTTTAENCIMFSGVKAPKRRMPQFRYIGMSVYQAVYEALIMDQLVTKGWANMIYRNQRWYYMLEGLNDMTKNNEQSLALERLRYMEDHASIYGAGVMDKNDDIKFIQQSFTGLPELDNRSIARLAAATNIPATILLGKSPDGMNSTGDSDLENFYNYIESEQIKMLPKMKKMFKILTHMACGQDIPFDFEWNKPKNIDISKQTEIDTRILENAKRMQEIGLTDDIVKHYMVDKGLITTEQASTIDVLESELEQQASKEDIENYENIVNPLEKETDLDKEYGI